MKTRISIAFWLIQHWMRLVFRRNNWPRTHNKYNEKRFLFLFFSCLNCHVTISPHVVRIAILKTIRVGNFSFVAFRFHVDMADPFDLACFFLFNCIREAIPKSKYTTQLCERVVPSLQMYWFDFVMKNLRKEKKPVSFLDTVYVFDRWKSVAMEDMRGQEWKKIELLRAAIK